ncbi:MAG: hypothetical protein WC788_07640 [Candidatus Paceibacterota bacterium]|jgi:hypothetical protein
MKDDELTLRDEVEITGKGRIVGKETDFSENIISVLVEIPLEKGKTQRLHLPPELIKKHTQ